MAWWAYIQNSFRSLSRVREFNQGARFRPQQYNYLPFNNKYDKLVSMFQTRLYHVNNTPFQLFADKYANDLANLHKQLNFLNARILFTRFSLVFAAISVYYWFIMEEEAKDWGDKFDLKFMFKAYGELEDASGQGNTGIDD